MIENLFKNSHGLKMMLTQNNIPYKFGSVNEKQFIVN